jgi:hypothetical protein
VRQRQTGRVFTAEASCATGFQSHACSSLRPVHRTHRQPKRYRRALAHRSSFDVPEFVVTGFLEVAPDAGDMGRALGTWGEGAAPSTGGAVRSASVILGRALHRRTPRRSRPGAPGPLAGRRVTRPDGQPRRPAPGAAVRSCRAREDRSRSGARRPAATGPGRRHGPQPPAAQLFRSSSGGSRFRPRSHRADRPGPGSSASSPGNSMTAASTTVTSAHCPSSSGRYWRHTGTGSASVVLPTCADVSPRALLQYPS